MAIARGWSPDGTKIAFTDWSFVKALDLVEGEERQLHDAPFDRIEVGFDWSPDGKRWRWSASAIRKTSC